jgi:hypothetical protein
MHPLRCPDVKKEIPFWAALLSRNLSLTHRQSSRCVAFQPRYGAINPNLGTCVGKGNAIAHVLMIRAFAHLRFVSDIQIRFRPFAAENRLNLKHFRRLQPFVENHRSNLLLPFSISSNGVSASLICCHLLSGTTHEAILLPASLLRWAFLYVMYSIVDP